MPKRLRLAAMMITLAVSACGGDDGGDGNGDQASANPLKEAVAKTQAAKTARMDIDISIGGGADQSFTGDVLVDFEHMRNLLTMEVEGQTVQLFADGEDEYIRQGTSGRYQPLPASAQSPVANNPSDSLQYLGTDVVGVKESGEGCYAGELDFDRVLQRVEEGRESEFPEELRGQRAPVLVCVDDEGRIRRYDVELTVQGTTVETKAVISDHGEVDPLEPLGPDERPR